jgi:diacylglycerol O-acyltransferase
LCYENRVAVDDGGSRQRVKVWHQVVLGLALLGVYLLVDRPDASRRAAADRQGRHISALEQRLHVDIERPLNGWLAPHKVLSTLAGYGYTFTYIISAFALLVWILVRRPDAFRRARDSFVVLNVIAIACFAFYPVTPPRLLPELGLVDTVALGNTWWSGLVDHGNQLAAMPSLHVSWALWVSVVLIRLGRGWVQVVSGGHVIVTVLIVFATANHYVLDAVAAAVLVAVSALLANVWHDRAARPGVVVPSSDAFFLHVETVAAPQHVGGLVVFEPSDGEALSVERVTDLVKGELDRLPRFRQRLGRPSRWRRQRWIDVTEIDWPLHISERHSADGLAGVRRIVAELAETPMPRDRPMWRIVMVRDVEPGVSAMILLLHHAVADGIGTVIQALNLLRPRIELPGVRSPTPGRAHLLGATIAGLAQLATDGGAGARLDNVSAQREFATAGLDLAALRRTASSRGVRVTDLLLGLVAEAVATTHPGVATRLRGRMRVAVPLMVRAPGAAAETNATAAVMVDVPLDGRPFDELVTEISRRTARLRTPSRAAASRFVMATGLRALPEPSAGWFARTVYGRRFFHAIVSNIPGSTQSLSMDGVTIASVYPILPLAPGSPLAVGALSWAGSLWIGVATDPEVFDAGVLAARIEQVLAASLERPHEREEEPRS